MARYGLRERPRAFSHFRRLALLRHRYLWLFSPGDWTALGWPTPRSADSPFVFADASVAPRVPPGRWGARLRSGSVRQRQVDDILIFDGVCNLCAHSVKFVLIHEAGPALRFAPSQSTAGSRLMRELGLDPEDAKTLILLAHGQVYERSDAAIRLAGYLRWPWKLLAATRIVPRPIRDWAYDLVARNRYRWFGRCDVCMVPASDLRARFIED